MLSSTENFSMSGAHMGPVQHSAHVWHDALAGNRCRHQCSLPLPLPHVIVSPPRIPAVLQIDWFTAGRQLSGPAHRRAVNCSLNCWEPKTEAPLSPPPWRGSRRRRRNTSELRRLSFPSTREEENQKTKNYSRQKGRVPGCSCVPALAVLRYMQADELILMIFSSIKSYRLWWLQLQNCST